MWGVLHVLVKWRSEEGVRSPGAEVVIPDWLYSTRPLFSPSPSPPSSPIVLPLQPLRILILFKPNYLVSCMSEMVLTFKIKLRSFNLEPGEMGQWLRDYTALAEDPDSIPSTHIGF